MEELDSDKQDTLTQEAVERITASFERREAAMRSRLLTLRLTQALHLLFMCCTLYILHREHQVTIQQAETRNLLEQRLREVNSGVKTLEQRREEVLTGIATLNTNRRIVEHGITVLKQQSRRMERLRELIADSTVCPVVKYDPRTVRGD